MKQPSKFSKKTRSCLLIAALAASFGGGFITGDRTAPARMEASAPAAAESTTAAPEASELSTAASEASEVSTVASESPESAAVAAETSESLAVMPAAAESAAPRKVIIDIDTGADDSSALILAAKNSAIDILGVTVLAGNVDLDQGAKNAEMALEMAGRDVPIYKGSAENYKGERIEAFSVFGTDGMGDADLIHPKKENANEDAIGFMLETIRQNPGEIEIIALGPATNIARAIQQDPETMKQTKMIWSMGTAGLGPGNASPVAEFNVLSDPEAYDIMLESGIPVTVVGLDMCGGQAQWTDQQFEELEQAGPIGQFVAASFGKIREFYASNGSAGSVMNCDSLAMTCALSPGFIRDTVQCHGSCITEPGETLGQVLFYQEGFTYDVVSNDYNYPVTLVTEVDQEHYFSSYLSAIR